MRQIVSDTVTTSKYRFNNRVPHPDRPPDLLSSCRDLVTNVDVEPQILRLQQKRRCLLQHLCEVRRLNLKASDYYFSSLREPFSCEPEPDWNRFRFFGVLSPGLLKQWICGPPNITVTLRGPPIPLKDNAVGQSVESPNATPLFLASFDPSRARHNNIALWSKRLDNHSQSLRSCIKAHSTRTYNSPHHWNGQCYIALGIEHSLRQRPHMRHSRTVTLRYPTHISAYSYDPVHSVALRSTSTSSLSTPQNILDEPLFLSTLNINRFAQLLFGNLGSILDVNIAISTVATSFANSKTTDHASRQLWQRSSSVTTGSLIALKPGTNDPDSPPPETPRPPSSPSDGPPVQPVPESEHGNDGPDTSPPNGPPIILFADPEYD